MKKKMSQWNEKENDQIEEKEIQKSLKSGEGLHSNWKDFSKRQSNSTKQEGRQTSQQSKI